MQLAQRLCELLMCRRKAAPVADYVLLQPSEDVELRELQAFLDENFKQLEITPADLRTFSRDTDVVNHLLKLLPLYRQCQSKCAFLKGYLSEGCLPHTRPAAEVECKKSQRILEALDILILKLVVGEFAMSEADSLEMLLDKFSTDQARWWRCSALWAWWTWTARKARTCSRPAWLRRLHHRRHRRSFRGKAASARTGKRSPPCRPLPVPRFRTR